MAKIELSIPDEWLGTIISRAIDLGIDVKDYFFLGALSLDHHDERDLIAGLELLGFDSCLSFMLKQLKYGNLEERYFDIVSRSNITIQILGGSKDCRLWLADVFVGLEDQLVTAGFTGAGEYTDIDEAFEMPLESNEYAVFYSEDEKLGVAVSGGARHEISERIKHLFLTLYQVQSQDITVVLPDPA